MSETIEFDESELLQFGSATMYEASGLSCWLDAAIRPAWPGARLVGRAFPVVAALGDNLALHHGIEQAAAGDVLVVDAGGGAYGYWGEVMTVAAQARGIRGLVIDGGVRDTDQLARLGFAAFSSTVAIRGTRKEWPGHCGLPITLRGRVIERGDLVVADADGIATIPMAHVAATITSARERAQKEEHFMARLRAGETTLDLYGFRGLGKPLRPAVGVDDD